MEQLAPHEKLFVDTAFTEDDENHGQIGCVECHGGNSDDPNWKTAHKGVVKDPTFPDPSKACGDCHEDITENSQHNLHVNLAAIKKTVGMRSNPAKGVCERVDEGRQNHCSSCHSSCGQCHVSRPESVQGGLLEGHVFKKNPPMQEVCTACHGSRIGKEYLGENKGIPADIHKRKYFKCTKCHTGDEMHGDNNDCVNRYEVGNGPKCLDCHEDIYDEKSPNAKQHRLHKDLLSCQVCHSMPYKNCYSCHVAKDPQGNAFFETKESNMNFMIGLNPLRSQKRPEKFVTVRHVPVDKNTFDFYTKNGLSNFDQIPTWKLTTPHNINRQTPQNKKCENCHGNSDFFLIEKDVRPEELNANKNVIVPLSLLPKKIAD